MNKIIIDTTNSTYVMVKVWLFDVTPIWMTLKRRHPSTATRLGKKKTKKELKLEAKKLLTEAINNL